MAARIGVKAVLTYRKKILLLKRSDDISRGGTWDIPGGLIEPEEKLLAGLQREVFEETGIPIHNVLFPLHIGYFNEGFYRFKNVIRVIYLSKVKTSKIQISGEHQDYKWVTLHDLKKLRPSAFIDPRILKNLIERIEAVMKCNINSFDEKVPNYLKGHSN